MSFEGAGTQSHRTDLAESPIRHVARNVLARLGHNSIVIRLQRASRQGLCRYGVRSKDRWNQQVRRFDLLGPPGDSEGRGCAQKPLRRAHRADARLVRIAYQVTFRYVVEERCQFGIE